MAEVNKTRKSLKDAPTPKGKPKPAPPEKTVAKGNGKTVQPVPPPVKGKKAAAPPPAKKASPKPKLPEPKVKYEKMSCKVDDPKLYAKFPELRTLVVRLRKEGYDNFYVQMSFTKAGVTNSKVGRIPIFMGLAGA